MDNPLVLDLFCGAGGAGMGYHQAGYDVVGIDIKPQPNYPFTFIQADAMTFPLEMLDWCNGRFPDLIHASPPCQGYSWGTRKGREEKWPLTIISKLRQIFGDYPYVIENIENAKRDMVDPIRLCGTMFNLKLLKHRMFESNLKLQEPIHDKHKGSVINGDYVTVAGHGGNNKTGNFGIPAWQEAMGIDWMFTRPELAEAIPPAYTKYVGEQLKDLI